MDQQNWVNYSAHAEPMRRKDWATFLTPLRGCVAPIDISLPLVGCAAALQAFLDLEFPVVPRNMFDVDIDLLNVLRPLVVQCPGANPGDIFVGPLIGNFLDVELTSLAACDGVIAGPPCPPFSQQGNRENAEASHS